MQNTKHFQYQKVIEWEISKVGAKTIFWKRQMRAFFEKKHSSSLRENNSPIK